VGQFARDSLSLKRHDCPSPTDGPKKKAPRANQNRGEQRCAEYGITESKSNTAEIFIIREENPNGRVRINDSKSSAIMAKS